MKDPSGKPFNKLLYVDCFNIVYILTILQADYCLIILVFLLNGSHYVFANHAMNASRLLSVVKLVKMSFIINNRLSLIPLWNRPIWYAIAFTVRLNQNLVFSIFYGY